MFGVDDGRADISGLGADVGVHFLDQTFLDQASLDQTEAALLLAGRDTGVRLEAGPTPCPRLSRSPNGSPQYAERLGG